MFLQLLTNLNYFQIGCNAVSWAPAIAPSAAFDSTTGARATPIKRFVSGGCDNLVKVWR